MRVGARVSVRTHVEYGCWGWVLGLRLGHETGWGGKERGGDESD